MTQIVTISFPLFALIALGYFAYRQRVVREEAPSILIGFVYYFLLPPFLFMKIADADLNAGLDAHVLLAYYIAAAVVFGLGYTSSRRRYPNQPKVIAIRSLASIASNTGYLGLPIVVLAYAQAAIIPGIAIVLIDNLIILLGGSLLLEAAQSSSIRWTHIAKEVCGKILRNPLIISIVVGLLYVLLIGVIPGPVRVLAKTLSDATIPCALFALGATLAQQRGQQQAAAAERYQVVFFKLLLHPLLAYALAKYVFALDDVFTAIVVVMASMPVSVNTFIMASRYDAYTKEISNILFLTTCLSVFVTTFLLFSFS